MEFKDYYKTLGLGRDASQDEIKRAYRRLARKFHPDVSSEPDAKERFQEVGEAYEVLKDPEKRAAYDRLGKDWRGGQEFRPPPGWDAGFEFSTGDFEGMDAARFSDFFESLFGRARPGFRGARGKMRVAGQDHHARILLDLEDAYHGATRTITLEHPEFDADGHIRNRTRSLNVRIPKGIARGQRIRLAGQGAPGIGGGESGDLYLEVDFKRHPLYDIEGKDVYLELPVAPWEAALGASIAVPTPAGRVEMKVPSGSQTGRKLRLKGRGIPSKVPGDLYVVLKIVLPEAISEREQAFYRKMREEFDFAPRADMEKGT